MIDSVLKGTGNSRFLKSAVPAGTSWADALAMLQAGTFPIDFNGINTDGFQQVGTPLNKANLLKDATAAQIGLPPSTTPDGMFQALGNTGELHVWRKIVTTAQEIPAGYTLENATNQKLAVKGDGGTAGYSLYVYYCSTISVDNNGTVHPGTETSIEFVSSANMDRLNACKGKFIRMGSGKYSSYTEGEFFIPSDAVFSFTNHVLTVNKCQKVNPYPLTPAGTTTTYPVSTNPNAYQEGEYGKAGYTLGDVKTGTFQIGQGATTIAANRAIIKYGASVSVTDTGTASIASESELTVTSDSSQSAVDKLKGKFFRFSQLPFSSSAFSVGKIYFFPANTVFTKQSSGNWYASKYQTVTSHGKTEPEYTIEYLGKLGDKARVQVVSYVGTGTYGSGKETKIPVDFPPELLVIALKDTTRRTVCISVLRSGAGLYLSADGTTSIYGESEVKVSYVNGEVRLQSYSNEYAQMNVNGYTYIAVVIG